MAEIKNLPIAEAERRLAEQLVPESDISGVRPDEYEAATAELERLENLYQSGHGRPVRER